MPKEISDYEVRCHTCFKKFAVQLFESHEKNLFLVDKKNWYCDTCKQAYFAKQTSKLAGVNQGLGFLELEGTLKRISWAEKIRAELINKVDFLQKNLSFNTEKEKVESNTAFNLFLSEWRKETDAKWWIDNRHTTVRDISHKIKKIKDRLNLDD